MATVKSTFTLDAKTIARLNETAERLQRSKSEVVREAIRDFSERCDRLSARESRRLLSTFDEVLPRIPERPSDEVDAELAGIRTARRSGGRGGRP